MPDKDSKRRAPQTRRGPDVPAGAPRARARSARPALDCGSLAARSAGSYRPTPHSAAARRAASADGSSERPSIASFVFAAGGHAGPSAPSASAAADTISGNAESSSAASSACAAPGGAIRPIAAAALCASASAGALVDRLAAPVRELADERRGERPVAERDHEIDRLRAQLDRRLAAVPRPREQLAHAGRPALDERGERVDRARRSRDPCATASASARAGPVRWQRAPSAVAARRRTSGHASVASAVDDDAIDLVGPVGGVPRAAVRRSPRRRAPTARRAGRPDPRRPRARRRSRSPRAAARPRSRGSRPGAAPADRAPGGSARSSGLERAQRRRVAERGDPVDEPVAALVVGRRRQRGDHRREHRRRARRAFARAWRVSARHRSPAPAAAALRAGGREQRGDRRARRAARSPRGAARAARAPASSTSASKPAPDGASCPPRRRAPRRRARPSPASSRSAGVWPWRASAPITSTQVLVAHPARRRGAHERGGRRRIAGS